MPITQPKKQRNPRAAKPVSTDQLRHTLLSNKVDQQNREIKDQIRQLQQQCGRFNAVFKAISGLEDKLVGAQEANNNLQTANLQLQLRNAELVVAMERANTMMEHHSQLAGYYRNRVLLELPAPVTPPHANGRPIECPAWIPSDYQLYRERPFHALAANAPTP
jgi:hypothetical protein